MHVSDFGNTLCFVFQLPVTFEDLAVSFTKKEWGLLDPAQKSLYWQVMEENYETISSVGKESTFPFI